MFDLPPGWLCVAVCAPALSSFAPLLFPASVSAVAASLGHADPPSLLATSSLLLSLLRLAALLQWWLQEPQVAPHLPLGLAPAGRRLYLLRLALALPLLAFGTALKAGAARALGVTGLFFGRQLGGRGLPWCTSWPYDVTAHPWHGGSVLIICAWFLLARTAPAGATLAVALWVGTHVAVVLLEEGLTCGPFAPEAYTAPLPEGAHPFYDGGIREASSAEQLRVVLMTPIAFLRACAFWVGIILYGLFVNLTYYLVRGDAERHALLVPATRLAASTVLFLCGFSVTLRGRQHLAAAQRSCAEAGGSFLIVSNHLSYMDILVLASIFGPYAAAARHDLLEWPIVGPVAKAWGVVGVVQSSIRERELLSRKSGAALAASASTGRLDALGCDTPTREKMRHSMDPSDAATSPMLLASPPTPGGPAAPPPASAAAGVPPQGRPSEGRGATAALSARARLPGSGVHLPPVLVFPEATCTVGGCLVSFRNGAFVAGVPVLPVTLRYRTPSGFNLSWVAPHSTGGHFLRSMCTWGKRVEVDILPLHVPTSGELASASEFGEAVRGEMAAALGWPALSGWSVRDAHQLHHDLDRAMETGTRVSVSTILRTPRTMD